MSENPRRDGCVATYCRNCEVAPCYVAVDFYHAAAPVEPTVDVRQDEYGAWIASAAVVADSGLMDLTLTGTREMARDVVVTQMRRLLHAAQRGLARS